MKGAAAGVALVTCSMMLGGCQSFLSGKFFASNRAKTEVASLDMSDYFQELIDTGKDDLMKGRISDAIVAFQQASYDSAHAPSAFNGLGVAYAQLGRPDLARRYFAEAAAADPSDPRFARNLARLDPPAEPALAEGAAGSDGAPAGELPALAAAAEPAQGLASPAAPVQAVQAQPALARVSAHEVRIAAMTPATRPAVVLVSSRGVESAPDSVLASGRVQSAGLVARRAPDFRVAAVSDATGKTRPSYPVRIALAAVK